MKKIKINKLKIVAILLILMFIGLMVYCCINNYISSNKTLNIHKSMPTTIVIGRNQQPRLIYEIGDITITRSKIAPYKTLVNTIEFKFTHNGSVRDPHNKVYKARFTCNENEAFRTGKLSPYVDTYCTVEFDKTEWKRYDDTVTIKITQETGYTLKSWYEIPILDEDGNETFLYFDLEFLDWENCK